MIDDTVLLERLRALHDRIRPAVRALLDRGALARGEDPGRDEAAVAHEGAGDLSFRIDLPAEREVERFAEELGRDVGVRLVSEGVGERDFGAGSPALRLVADPVDGTRPLMFDLRSGFILTAVADERGDATSLADVRVALQSEIPTSDRATFAELAAIRGAGATIRRRALGGATLSERALRASTDARLDNGIYSFFKFSPEERVAIARVEEDFLRALVAHHGVDSRTLYDDQYICNAGQLYLVLTQRYRFVADLRAFLGDLLGLSNFTTKPYDVCCALICREAGVPLTDPRGRILDVPLTLDARVSFVAYANESVRARLEPLLFAAIERFRAALPP